MENWMVLVASVILLSGFAFLANVLYTDDMSERKRILMCSIPLLLITALIIILAIMKNGETSKNSSSPVKTATADSSIAANEENKDSSFVVEPNDTTEAGSFVTEAYQRGDHSVVQTMEMELRNNAEALARYLQEYDALGEFVSTEGRPAETAVIAAVLLFSKDEDVREEAYRKAKKLFHDSLADVAWEEFKKTDPRSDEFDTYEEYQAYLRNPAAPTRLQPLARIAETGETISTEPAGPWEGLSD